MPYGPATILQTATSQPPLLSARSILIANLHKFNYACKHFFAYKEIPTQEQVGCIIYSFESEFMQSWIKSDSDRLIALSFSEFMLKVKCKWLPTDWEDELIQELITPQGDRDFYEWSISICKVNNELKAADSLQHIPDTQFPAHLITHLNPALCLAYCASKKELDAVADIEAWIHCIVILDVQCATHQKQIAMSMAHTTKNAVKLTHAYTQSTSNTVNNTLGAATSSSTSNLLVSFIALPKLTQPEKGLLDLHKGCYKCHTFYAGHFSRTCTAEHPSLDACKKVTAAHALWAKAA
ncbi:hypothetical protein L208DRAFT_1255123, partial [Tricholoma matsutake]